jgi:hypothetical protein
VSPLAPPGLRERAWATKQEPARKKNVWGTRKSKNEDAGWKPALREKQKQIPRKNVPGAKAGLRRLFRAAKGEGPTRLFWAARLRFKARALLAPGVLNNTKGGAPARPEEPQVSSAPSFYDGAFRAGRGRDLSYKDSQEGADD